MTDAISLAPVVSVTGQFLLAAAGAAITAATPVLTRITYKYLRLKFTDAQWAVFDRTAMNFARQWWAKADASLGTASIHVGNPVVADLANAAISRIPEIVAKLGLTPGKAGQIMREYIVSHIGAMQAQAVAPTPAGPVRVSQ
jgi:hypothetical protein